MRYKKGVLESGYIHQTLLRTRADSFPSSSGNVLQWRAIKCVSSRREGAQLMPMSLEEQIRLLSMVDILGPLSEKEMEDLAKHTPDTFLDQGDVLYTPQEGTERLFILKRGRVQLYEMDRGGNEITLSVVEDGNFFGEMALTGQSLAGVYVRALTPSTVVTLRREELERLIMKKPEVGLRLVRELAEKLHASEARYSDIIGKDVPARLADLILAFVDSEGVVLSLVDSESVVSKQSYRIPTHYTHERIASMIGCKRVAVTQAFRKLEEGGAVELEKRRIIVKDVDALRSLAEAS
ncbi:MAG TPA: Crp/Fnr family transcriptional regulator [Rubrobacter sp.]|nr:Crp/Fnr family transcriptional regulator [Rubrobacter sp.]